MVVSHLLKTASLTRIAKTSRYASRIFFSTSLHHRANPTALQQRYNELHSNKLDVIEEVKDLQKADIEKIRSIINRIEIAVTHMNGLVTDVKNTFTVPSSSEITKEDVIEKMNRDLSMFYYIKMLAYKEYARKSEEYEHDCTRKAISCAYKAHDLNKADLNVITELCRLLYDNREDEPERLYSALSFVDKAILIVESDYTPEKDSGRLYALRAKIISDPQTFKRYGTAIEDLNKAIEQAHQFDYPYKYIATLYCDRAKCRVDQVVFPEDEDNQIEITPDFEESIDNDIKTALKFAPDFILIHLVTEKFYSKVKKDVVASTTMSLFIRSNLDELDKATEKDPTYIPYAQMLLSEDLKVGLVKSKMTEEQFNNPKWRPPVPEEKKEEDEYIDEEKFFQGFNKEYFTSLLNNNIGKAQQCANASMDAFQEGDLNTAMSEIDRAIKRDGDDPNYYHQRTLIHHHILLNLVNEGRDEDIEEHPSAEQLKLDCAKLEDMIPNNFITHQAWARYKTIIREFGEAMNHYKKAIKFGEDDEDCEDEFMDQLKKELEIVKEMREKTRYDD